MLSLVRMMNQAATIRLTDEQRRELERRVRSQTLDARSVRRARIVLLAAEGVGNHEIARRLEISRGQVIAWRDRFAKGGIASIGADCWQQIELSGFVVNELSALVAAKNSVEGAARNRIFSRRRLRRTYAAAFKLDASPFPVLS